MKTLPAEEITGLVLAGGRGSRMGGVDKGLQLFHGQPLARHAAERLQPQVGQVLINANRNLDRYRSFGDQVCPDELADYAGPLAGFLAGLAVCRTEFMATVPCDSPLFPPDLVMRLADVLQRAAADLAMAVAPQEDGQLHRQPVFCLFRTSLQASLAAFTAAGGRKIGAWAEQQAMVQVPFDAPGDDRRAFYNANTLDELDALQRG